MESGPTASPYAHTREMETIFQHGRDRQVHLTHTVAKLRQAEINCLALFSSNDDQSTDLISGTFGGIEGKAGEQTGERNDILENET